MFGNTYSLVFSNGVSKCVTLRMYNKRQPSFLLPFPLPPSQKRARLRIWDGMGWDGMGWDGMGWDGMGWDGMGWDVLFCFVLFCFVKNALARVVLVPSRRLPIFSSVVRFPYPCITRAPPPPFFFFPPNIFMSS